MSKPRNCRHCTWMFCGDANWCSKHEECMSDMQIWAARKCPEWEWNPIDALTGQMMMVVGESLDVFDHAD